MKHVNNEDLENKGEGKRKEEGAVVNEKEFLLVETMM